ncbi:hypothetical protein [Paenibacillus sp. MMS18-CY102]|uniref:hypothetical protein n=1 Tax=Paenibacillus sp. MMS18-CY102 TaxID=2682849 RepID=UPI0013659AFD|nr:hypothetical protein [Paenibacillus sp. MMS18-CY102]MWC26649.1 hypothetical protein [Paenibacillus sp. MMS18-CY102]
MNPRAMQLIEFALQPLIGSSRGIQNVELIVSPESELAKCSSLMTRFGELEVRAGEYVPKGFSYIIGKPNLGIPRVFSWVVRKQTVIKDRAI